MFISDLLAQDTQEQSNIPALSCECTYLKIHVPFVLLILRTAHIHTVFHNGHLFSTITDIAYQTNFP